MQVEIHNDGPVTLMLDTAELLTVRACNLNRERRNPSCPNASIEHPVQRPIRHARMLLSGIQSGEHMAAR